MNINHNEEGRLPTGSPSSATSSPFQHLFMSPFSYRTHDTSNGVSADDENQTISLPALTKSKSKSKPAILTNTRKRKAHSLPTNFHGDPHTSRVAKRARILVARVPPVFGKYMFSRLGGGPGENPLLKPAVRSTWGKRGAGKGSGEESLVESVQVGSIKPEEPVAESSEGTAQSESTEILKQESTKDEDGVRLDEEQAALLGRLQLGDVDMDS